MSLYDELTKPILHRGATDTITAAELRNCLGRVATTIEEKLNPLFAVGPEGMELVGFASDMEAEEATGTAVGDDGPAAESLTPANEADTE